VQPQHAARISLMFGFLAWGVVATLYIWPSLKGLALSDAMRPLLVLHSFRYLGLAFLVPGVVSHDLSATFARPAAYGDIISSILALIALVGLSSGSNIALLWLFNAWGAGDLLYAFFNAFRLVAARKLSSGHFGAAFYIPNFFVPLLLITHGLMFGLLLRM
jgi:hypothetical protein